MLNRKQKKEIKKRLFEHGETVLHFLVKQSSEKQEDCKILEKVLQRKYIGFKLSSEEDIVVNARCKQGRTPLHLAAKLSNCAAMKVLLEYDASVNIIDWSYRYPLDYVMGNQNIEAFELLMKYGAIFHAKREKKMKFIITDHDFFRVFYKYFRYRNKVRKWKPKKYKYYSYTVRKGIRYLLLCFNRYREIVIPRVIKYLIIEKLIEENIEPSYQDDFTIFV